MFYGIQVMSTVTEIESAVNKLTSFREWFQEFDADAWDFQFEEDVRAGRLDALAQEALRDMRNKLPGMNLSLIHI